MGGLGRLRSWETCYLGRCPSSASPTPFDSDEFIYELKLDGFRALAQIEGHRCTLISRNGHMFHQWPMLNDELAHAVRCNSAILEDGEFVCLDRDGRPNFHKLLFRRDWPFFYAFDVLPKITFITALIRKRLADCGGWR